MEPINKYRDFTRQLERQRDELQRLPFAVASENGEGHLAQSEDQVYLFGDEGHDQTFKEQRSRAGGWRRLLFLKEPTVHFSDGSQELALDPRGTVRPAPFPGTPGIEGARKRFEESKELLELCQQNPLRKALETIPFGDLENAKRALQPLAPALPGPVGAATLTTLMISGASATWRPQVREALAPVLADILQESDNARLNTLGELSREHPKHLKTLAHLATVERSRLSFDDVKNSYDSAGGSVAQLLIEQLTTSELPSFGQRLVSAGGWNQKTQLALAKHLRGGDLLKEGLEMAKETKEALVSRSALLESSVQETDPERQQLLANLATVDEPLQALKIAADPDLDLDSLSAKDFVTATQDLNNSESIENARFYALRAEDAQTPHRTFLKSEGSQLEKHLAASAELNSDKMREAYALIRGELQPQETAFLDILAQAPSTADLVGTLKALIREHRAERERGVPAEFALAEALKAVPEASQQKLIPELVNALEVKPFTWLFSRTMQQIVADPEVAASPYLKTIVESSLRKNSQFAAGWDDVVVEALRVSGDSAAGVLRAAAQIVKDGCPDDIHQELVELWKARNPGKQNILSSFFDPRPVKHWSGSEKTAAWYRFLADHCAERPDQLRQSFNHFKQTSFAEPMERGVFFAINQLAEGLSSEESARLWQSLPSEISPRSTALMSRVCKRISPGSILKYCEYRDDETMFAEILYATLNRLEPEAKDEFWGEALDCLGVPAPDQEAQLYSGFPELGNGREQFLSDFQNFVSQLRTQHVASITEVEFSEDELQVGEQILSIAV